MIHDVEFPSQRHMGGAHLVAFGSPSGEWALSIGKEGTDSGAEWERGAS